jgi:transcriptional regulator with AAA-type ATPase domain
MAVRIKLDDLSSEGRASSIYHIHYEANGAFQTSTLGTGDFYIGSGSDCDLSIPAPGVRRRHVRLKRHDDRIFIEGVRDARVICAGKMLEGLTSLSLSAAFQFGSVRATIERQAPEDREVAVRIKGVSAPLRSQSTTARDIPVPTRAVSVLNDALKKCVHRKESTIEFLLEAIVKEFSPIHLALFQSWGTGSVILLGEHGTPPPETKGVSQEDLGYKTYNFQVFDSHLRLEILFSEDDDVELKANLCQTVLYLAAMFRESPSDNSSVENPVMDTFDPWDEFVGAAIKLDLERVTELSRHSDAVIVLGETGTGKELVARGLHRLWNRKGAFVALNCAAIPSELLEAELFGTEAGMATGVTARSGRILQAEGGTLFLDEISSLPVEMQSKLLRVLQEREYYTLGGSKLLKADVNIVAASNHEEEQLRSGEEMRQDLFFRLSQATVRLRPLRQRVQDLPVLCEAFLYRLESEYRRGIPGLSVSAMQAMKAYPWPGNVRELQNLLRQLYFGTQPGQIIQKMQLPTNFPVGGEEVIADGTLAEMIRTVEKQAIERELHHQPSVADAAKALGLSEGYLYRKLKKLGLKSPRQN